MKKIIKLIFIVALLTSCNSTILDSDPPQTTVNYVFIDITGDEKFGNVFSDEQIDKFKNSLGWKKDGDVYNGGVFKIFSLSDLSNTESKTFELVKGKTGLNGQPSLARKMDTDNFIKKNLKPGLNDFIKNLGNNGRTESEIFGNLCKQLKDLVEKPADKKNVIIYSDLLENSKLFSFYNSKMVTQDEFKTAAYGCKFPDLTEVNVYIVPPLNNENEEMVKVAEKEWKSFFAYKNAKSFHHDINLTLE
jgi:hypothetical protein